MKEFMNVTHPGIFKLVRDINVKNNLGKFEDDPKRIVDVIAYCRPLLSILRVKQTTSMKESTDVTIIPTHSRYQPEKQSCKVYR